MTHTHIHRVMITRIFVHSIQGGPDPSDLNAVYIFMYVSKMDPYNGLHSDSRQIPRMNKYISFRDADPDPTRLMNQIESHFEFCPRLISNETKFNLSLISNYCSSVVEMRLK